MKNIATKMFKDPNDGLNSRLNRDEERISELQDNVEYLTQNITQRGKEIKYQRAVQRWSFHGEAPTFADRSYRKNRMEKLREKSSLNR